MADMSPIAATGTAALKELAAKRADAVLKERTPEAAFAYIGLVPELVGLHTPPEGALGIALDIAVADMEKAQPTRVVMQNTYDFFAKNVAGPYGLADKVQAYHTRIAELNGFHK